MKKLLIIATALSIVGGLPMLAQASPSDDLKTYRSYFQKKFPKVAFETYVDGIYALDEDRRAAWQEFEDFAPAYEDAIEVGKELFNKPFANGKTYASCFKNGGVGIKQNYPYFDAKSGKVKTLEMEINECRAKNGEEEMKYGKGKFAAIAAYMAYTSRGKTINVKVPDDPRAQAIYESGKRIFFQKRGQLNFSCADCHMHQAGSMARGNLLSPALGQVSHFPVWRKKWASKAKDPNDPTRGLGTLQRRYGGCNKQVRAKPYKPQKDEYVALEYFHTHISNGLKINAPSLRQ